MPSDTVFSTCLKLQFWILAHSDGVRSPPEEAWHKGRDFCCVFPLGSLGGSWGPVAQQIQPTACNSASAPSQAASFPAITLALRAQKNWPTPAVGFCISEICAPWCSGSYTALTWLPIDARCVDRRGAQHAGEPSAAPGLPDFQQHGWTCCYGSSQPEQGNV